MVRSVIRGPLGFPSSPNASHGLLSSPSMSITEALGLQAFLLLATFISWVSRKQGFGGGGGGRPRRQLDTCDLSREVHTIPESAFHLGLGQMHTRPMQQLQPFSAAATLVVAKTGAGFAGSVAGLTFSHLRVAVEARATVPHAAAAYVRTQNGGMKRSPG